MLNDDAYADELTYISKQFQQCRDMLQVIGDASRQRILIALLESDFNGIRVGEITQKTWLSRPAVSHHLGIMKDVGIINMRKEGTKHYYYVDSNYKKWEQVAALFNRVHKIAEDFSLQKKENQHIQKG